MTLLSDVRAQLASYAAISGFGSVPYESLYTEDSDCAESIIGVVSQNIEKLITQWYDEEWGFEEDGWRFVRDLRSMLGTSS